MLPVFVQSWFFFFDERKTLFLTLYVHIQHIQLLQFNIMIFVIIEIMKTFNALVYIGKVLAHVTGTLPSTLLTH